MMIHNTKRLVAALLIAGSLGTSTTLFVQADEPKKSGDDKKPSGFYYYYIPEGTLTPDKFEAIVNRQQGTLVGSMSMVLEYNCGNVILNEGTPKEKDKLVTVLVFRKPEQSSQLVCLGIPPLGDNSDKKTRLKVALKQPTMPRLN